MHRLALLSQGGGGQRKHAGHCIIRHVVFMPGWVMHWPIGSSHCLWLVSPAASMDPEGNCWPENDSCTRCWGMGQVKPEYRSCCLLNMGNTRPLLLCIAGAPPWVCACADQQQHPQPRSHSLAQQTHPAGSKLKRFIGPRPTCPWVFLYSLRLVTAVHLIPHTANHLTDLL